MRPPQPQRMPRHCRMSDADVQSFCSGYLQDYLESLVLAARVQGLPYIPFGSVLRQTAVPGMEPGHPADNFGCLDRDPTSAEAAAILGTLAAVVAGLMALLWVS